MQSYLGCCCTCQPPRLGLRPFLCPPVAACSEGGGPAESSAKFNDWDYTEVASSVLVVLLQCHIALQSALSFYPLGAIGSYQAAIGSHQAGLSRDEPP